MLALLLLQAQQRAEEAVAREQATAQKLLARERDVSSAKGEAQVRPSRGKGPSRGGQVLGG